jgi:hypothetical protein
MFLQDFSMEKRGTWNAGWSAPNPTSLRPGRSTASPAPDLIACVIESGYNNMSIPRRAADVQFMAIPPGLRLTVVWWEDEAKPLQGHRGRGQVPDLAARRCSATGTWPCREQRRESKVSGPWQSGQTTNFDLAKNPALLQAGDPHYVPKFLPYTKSSETDTLGFRRQLA